MRKQITPEELELRKIHDHEIRIKAFENGSKVELKVVNNKKKHPFAIEDIRTH